MSSLENFNSRQLTEKKTQHYEDNAALILYPTLLQNLVESYKVSDIAILLRTSTRA